MEILKYINNDLNKYYVPEPPVSISIVKDLIYSFIGKNGYPPTYIYVNESVYKSLEKEVAYLPSWIEEWEILGSSIIFMKVTYIRQKVLELNNEVVMA